MEIKSKKKPKLEEQVIRSADVCFNHKDCLGCEYYIGDGEGDLSECITLLGQDMLEIIARRDAKIRDYRQECDILGSAVELLARRKID